MASKAALDAVKPYEKFVSRSVEEVATDLEHYVALLTKWQKVQNLVSRETLQQVWTRHIADSLQVLKFLNDTDKTVVDLGSGGGFPALPMAIGSKGSDRTFTLVEPTGRKASFLRTVARELQLPVKVENSRAEEIDSRETLRPDVITSRALASLDTLCTMSAPLFAENTRAIFHKGREHGEEVVESRVRWHHDVLVLDSDTDPDGVLIELQHLRLN
jgi:16S rRNA (guanine527-N7)-methyltransferase